MRHHHLSGSSSENSSTNANEMISNQNDIFAIKSSPKPKSRSVQRQTKRPPSERRFKCDQCDRMFFTRKDVKRHLVVHTGIRNFACPFCTQRFGRKDHLVRHAKKSHNKDTRTSAANKTTSSQGLPHNNNNNNTTTIDNDKTSLPMPRNASPEMIVPNALPNKHSSAVYSNGQTSGDHQTLTILPLVNEHHHHPGNLHPNAASNAMAGEPFYMHNLDDMMTNSHHHVKTESTGSLSSHHYLTFPVNATSPVYHHTAFLPGCFVANTGNVNSCANSVATFGIPVSVCGDHPANGNSIHAFSVDVNTSLPHFSQAFQ